MSRIAGWLSAFEFGAFRPLSVRYECVDLGLSRTLQLLYASDLHLGHWWTNGVPDQLLAVCRRVRPDFILLGGDLADRRVALDRLHDCVRELADVAPVLAVPGNHDERTGLAGIRDAVEAGDGRWLPAHPLAGPLRIDGQLDPVPGTSRRLLCAHDPGIFPVAVRAGYGLVLAGHLHGGQCVLATVGGRLYPAAWLHRWHGLRFAEAGSTMLVSRGAADTFPFRFNCPREVILCEIG